MATNEPDLFDLPAKQRLVGGQPVSTAEWPGLDEAALDQPALGRYLSRKLAVALYLAGESGEAIQAQCGISAKQVYRLIRERCLTTHSDGRLYGWRALVPNYRIRPYKRRKALEVDEFGRGAVGALGLTLDRHPELRARLETRILSQGPGARIVEVRRGKRREWLWFLDQLRDFGYEARGEWPFNTVTRGYHSFARLVDRTMAADTRALALAAGGPDLLKKLRAGDGGRRPALKFMQRVEMDAHKLDGLFCVALPQRDGTCVETTIHRLWVTVLVEVTSRAVLGYYLSLGREVTKDDVLRAIRRALTRWTLRETSFAQQPYLQGAGLLSSCGKEFIGLCWDETSVDGALAETCKSVAEALKNVVGSALIHPNNSYAARRSKDDRPFIESFFRNLSTKGFQRLSNTTGRNVHARPGTRPEEVAVASNFQLEYAEELLDVLIANYNATPHSGIGMRTPLAYARMLFRLADKQWRHADTELVDSYFSVRRLCSVRGGAREGRAPFVQFAYARYSNEILANRQDLAGTKIWVICHLEDDCRVARASTTDGLSLGVLRVAAPWHVKPHSLQVRTAVHRAMTASAFTVPPGGDAIELFMRHCEKQKGKRLPYISAYLNERRILDQALGKRIGEQMVEHALSRAAAVASGPRPDETYTPSDPHPAVPGVPQTPTPVLPRRFASSRQS